MWHRKNKNSWGGKLFQCEKLLLRLDFFFKNKIWVNVSFLGTRQAPNYWKQMIKFYQWRHYFSPPNIMDWQLFPSITACLIYFLSKSYRKYVYKVFKSQVNGVEIWDWFTLHNIYFYLQSAYLGIFNYFWKYFYRVYTVLIDKFRNNYFCYMKINV